MIGRVIQRKWRRRIAVINVMGAVGLPMRTNDLAPYLGRESLGILGDFYYLEDHGFLTSEWEPERSDGAARRRYYTLTALGTRAYDRREWPLEPLIEFMKRRCD